MTMRYDTQEIAESVAAEMRLRNPTAIAVRVLPDGTPVFRVDPGDPQGDRTETWPPLTKGKLREPEPEPTKIQDHRARKVRIRRGDSDV